MNNHLQLKDPIDDSNTKILQQIKSTNSISIHIRRGDYLNSDVHIKIPLDYYNKAIKIITSKINNPYFYIFSDDINWAKENLVLDNPHIFVDINNEKTGYLDFELMRNCKHNIIANSTFSWWAAWLNNNSNKIVISPKHWLSNQTEPNDLLPPSWLII